MIPESKPTAIVTGATSDVGFAAAQALFKAGYRVFGTSRKANASPDPDIKMVQCDITDEDSVERAITTILTMTERIDILVNNVVVRMVGAAEETSIDQARQLFEVNLFGTLRMVRAVLPMMRASGRGRIINVNSVFGFMPAPYMALYAATKHAVEGYTESLDHEVRSFGIRAVLVEPASTTTAFSADMNWATGMIEAYGEIRFSVLRMLRALRETGDSSDIVAEAILRAAQDQRGTLRFPAGQGRKLTLLRRFVPAKAFDRILRKRLRLPEIL